MRHILTIALVALAACGADDWGPDKLFYGKSPAELSKLRKGREVYAQYCVGCHGENGDGQGRAARFLAPKPRDFTVGRIKFGAVSAGESARAEDYLRIVTNGLAGTSMPEFRFVPLEEREAVVAYIRSFYKEAAEDPPGAAIRLGQDPFSEDPAEGVAEGERVYHGLAKCWSCHPAYATRARIATIHLEEDLSPPELRANLYEGDPKDSQWGAPIRAPDFLRERIKNGFDVESIARVVASGIGGTAMPTWAGSIDDDKIWGLAYYVNSIARQRGTSRGRALRESLLTQTSTKAE